MTFYNDRIGKILFFNLEHMHGLENELSRMDRKIFSQKVVNNKQKRRTLNAKISLVPQIIYISELLRLSS